MKQNRKSILNGLDEIIFQEFNPYLVIPAAIILIVVLISFSSSIAMAEPKCEPVNGHIEARVVPPEDCPSLFGLCTEGTMIGGIQGEFYFNVTSFTPLLDTNIPAVALYTGEIVVHTKNGDVLFGTEAGAFDTANGDFSELLTITGGTGDVVSGNMAIYGFVDLDKGEGKSDYKGEVCTR